MTLFCGHVDVDARMDARFRPGQEGDFLPRLEVEGSHRQNSMILGLGGIGHSFVELAWMSQVANTGRWWCFDACNDGRDVLDFVMRAEGVTFPEAVRRLGGGQLSPPRAMPPPPMREKGFEERVLTDAHYALLTTAVEVCHAALLSNPRALAYASSRGLDADTVREFRLGYAAGRPKRYLAFRGGSEELAADLGWSTRAGGSGIAGAW